MSLIGSLVTAFPYKPYFYYRSSIPEGGLNEYFSSFLKSLHDRLIIDTDNEAISAFSITPLSWDTEKLGLRAGRVDFLFGSSASAAKRAVSGAISKARQLAIQYLSVRINANDIDMLHALEEYGFRTVDGILTFSRSTGSGPASPASPLAVRSAVHADIPQIRLIASRIYRFDRFHSDPAIPRDRADLLHADWMENSVLGTAADNVIIAEYGDNIAGFVTCTIDESSRRHLGLSIGTIVLVGTSEEYQGKGVASTITAESLCWFRSRGVHIVEVGTQLGNILASRTYIRSGFNLVNTSISLRKIM